MRYGFFSTKYNTTATARIPTTPRAIKSSTSRGERRLGGSSSAAGSADGEAARGAADAETIRVKSLGPPGTYAGGFARGAPPGGAPAGVAGIPDMSRVNSPGGFAGPGPGGYGAGGTNEAGGVVGAAGVFNACR